MTEQRKLFCIKLIENKFNGTKAAIEAGYSKKTAKVKASQLLMDEEVQNYLAELKSETKEKYNISVEELVNDFRSIQNSNVTDIFDIRDNKIVFKKGIKTLSELLPEVTKNIKSIKNTANGIAIEMYDRDGALRDLAKIAGLYVDKVEHSGDVNITVNGIAKL